MVPFLGEENICRAGSTAGAWAGDDEISVGWISM